MAVPIGTSPKFAAPTSAAGISFVWGWNPIDVTLTAMASLQAGVTNESMRYAPRESVSAERKLEHPDATTEAPLTGREEATSVTTPVMCQALDVVGGGVVGGVARMLEGALGVRSHAITLTKKATAQTRSRASHAVLWRSSMM